MKIASEISQAPRSWFVTLTVAPDIRAQFAMKSELVALRRGVAWAEMTPEQQFRSLHGVISREITLYLKRVRERVGAPLRFVLVCEKHKDGYPHFHAVIHETESGTVRYRDIVEPWAHGFAHAKLVQEDGARKTGAYVAKYLSKSAFGRVRASRGYGQPPPAKAALRTLVPPREKTLTHTEQSVGEAGFTASAPGAAEEV